MSHDKPRINRVDPEDLRALREVNPDLPEMSGSAWRSAWDRLFRAAHEGMCWVAATRGQRGENGGGGKKGAPLGYLAAQRQFFSKCVITDLSVAADEGRGEIAQGLLRFVEGRFRGETIHAVVDAADEQHLALFSELGFEPAGRLAPLGDGGELLFLRKAVAERPSRGGGAESETKPAEGGDDAASAGATEPATAKPDEGAASSEARTD